MEISEVTQRIPYNALKPLCHLMFHTCINSYAKITIIFMSKLLSICRLKTHLIILSSRIFPFPVNFSLCPCWFFLLL